MSKVLEVKDLSVRFDTHQGTVRAVDRVSFYLEEGETLGLVGESGSGKSVTNLALLGLIPNPPGVIDSGQVLFEGDDLLKLPIDKMRKIRGNKISMIFQDPMTSLNPLLTIEQQLAEVLEIHRGMKRREARPVCANGLGEVGIPSPEKCLDSYPHELSGGMRQRVMIAMALLCQPKVLLADEPTTALDVTIQAQILELMASLQKRHGTAIILVTHDMGVVAGQADRVNVMYAGRLAETAATRDLFSRPMHPYSKGLLESVPRLFGDADGDLYSVKGQPPDVSDLPPGCAFAPRCDFVVESCKSERPDLHAQADAAAETERFVACTEAERVLLNKPSTPGVQA
ncbi:MAG: oligopeptide transport system ATP-binding protein [Planctomycetota bacterium]|jgi:oligopeptide transport system ATP-binding protein